MAAYTMAAVLTQSAYETVAAKLTEVSAQLTPQPNPSESPLESTTPDAAQTPLVISTPKAPAAVGSRPSPEVLGILEAMPGLRTGAALQLNEVGEALRRHQILKGKSASPSRLLKRLAADFELVPKDKPRTVRYLGAGAR